MNLKKDIRPLSDFKRNTGEILQHLRRSRRPVVLTINGRAEMVVQDAEAYQKLLDEIDRMEANEGIRKGLAAVEAGKTRPVREGLPRSRNAVRYTVEIAEPAEHDIEGAREWIDAESPAAATRWLDGLLS